MFSDICSDANAIGGGERERDPFLWNEEDDRLFDPIELSLFDIEIHPNETDTRPHTHNAHDHMHNQRPNTIVFSEANGGAANEREFDFDFGSVSKEMENEKDDVRFGEQATSFDNGEANCFGGRTTPTFGCGEDDELLGWIEGIDFGGDCVFPPLSPHYSPFCGPNEFDERVDWQEWK